MHDEIKRGRFGDYMLTERLPTVAEYCSLRVGAGLTPKDPMAAEAGLARTLYAVCLEYRGEAIGMGRVIGDGGVFFDVVDIAVVPDHQKKVSARRSWMLSWPIFGARRGRPLG